MNALKFSPSFVFPIATVPNWRTIIDFSSKRTSAEAPLENSSMAAPYSWTTVPDFGEGISLRGPKILPNRANFGIIAGLAMSTSKSMASSVIFCMRASPAQTAPNERASSVSASSQKTATLSPWPVPCGSETVVRSCSSGFLGSKFMVIFATTNLSPSRGPRVVMSRAMSRASEMPYVCFLSKASLPSLSQNFKNQCSSLERLRATKLVRHFSTVNHLGTSNFSSPHMP
mmetsp:Transcript_99869/g.253991  ORF Transcript_99869/g.253991 Transcript_99869/m.253991 type:complete len:229 (-) Transcript_99869:473-1159(-)